MKFETITAKPISYGRKRDYSEIKYIVVHWTSGTKDTAKNNANYYANGNTREAGAHYFIDSGDIVYKSVPLNRVGWSVGGNRCNNYKQTGGAKLYGIVTNTNSASIEMCSYAKRDNQIEKNCIWLIHFLMNKYNIPKENVVRHFDVTGKNCPNPLCDEKSWKEFKSRI